MPLVSWSVLGGGGGGGRGKRGEQGTQLLVWKGQTQVEAQSTYNIVPRAPSSALRPPHPLSRKRECTPPPLKQGGGHTHLRVRGLVGGPNSVPKNGEKLSILSTLWVEAVFFLNTLCCLNRNVPLEQYSANAKIMFCYELCNFLFNKV